MSRVYVRNRKPSSYKKFIQPSEIKKELYKMYNIKHSERYFPKGLTDNYDKLYNLINEIDILLNDIYNIRYEKERNGEYIQLIYPEILDVINKIDSSLSILQTHYLSMELNKKNLSKTKIKVARRFQNLGYTYYSFYDGINSYKKSLKQKAKHNNINLN